MFHLFFFIYRKIFLHVENRILLRVLRLDFTAEAGCIMMIFSVASWSIIYLVNQDTNCDSGT